MAQKAKKDLAKANTTALNNLHLTSLALNVAFVLLSLIFKSRSRTLYPYAILSIPAFICQFILERSGRPKYVVSPGSSTKTLKSSGEDLAAEGLTEYLFDVVWVTWTCLIAVSLFGNKAWFLYAIVPAFGLYKGYGLLGMARGLMGGGAQTVQGTEAEQPAAAGNRRQRRQAA